MKIAAFSDTHSLHQIWSRKHPLPEADTIIFGGDLSNRGYVQEIQFFFDWFNDLNYENKIFIAGNHDFGFDNEDRSLVIDMIPEGIHYLENNDVIIDGVKFWGSPITPRFFNWAFMRDRGIQIKNVWDDIPNDTDILITHGPPRGILDLTQEGINAGCQDLLDAINRVNPKYNIFGHIHESHGVTHINGTTFMNVSAVNRSYEPSYDARLFEI